MRTFPDVRMRKLLSLAERASAALNGDDYPEAKRLFRELLGQLAGHGLDSASAHWGLAVTHDCLEEYDMALNSILTALALDPLASATQRSFDVIVQRVREHLGRLPATDASVPRLYALLQQSGALDVPSHLVMARHLAETGRPDDAERLYAALCRLAPASRDVWEARARFADSRGDVTAAATFRAEAQARGLAEVPYGIPTKEEH
ncbi:MAG: tetratricopeptide repeat protein [Myxococcota bacterium]